MDQSVLVTDKLRVMEHVFIGDLWNHAISLRHLIPNLVFREAIIVKKLPKSTKEVDLRLECHTTSKDGCFEPFRRFENFNKLGRGCLL